jgi:glucokinase
MILAGDIGGTKTVLALFERDGDVRSPVRSARYASNEHPSLDDIVSRFLAEGGERPTRAAFGIAGPVTGDVVDATNLSWDVDTPRLRGTLGGIPLRLLNDLEATAWGVGTLPREAFELLHAGEPRPGHRALIAAGTGLGEALMVWDGRSHHPVATEGGHTDFAPRDEVEEELLRWLRARHGRVSYERVLSGGGLANLHRFLTETGGGVEPAEITRAIETADDPARAVSEAAAGGRSERARIAMRMFCEIYGAEAGNLALKSLALGGVYVGGGIAPRNLPFLRDGRFIRGFTAKGRLSPILMKIPVAVILDDRAALWGAAAAAFAED